MVAVVQLVRASDCGSECRGFESHLPPGRKEEIRLRVSSFSLYISVLHTLKYKYTRIPVGTLYMKLGAKKVSKDKWPSIFR